MEESLLVTQFKHFNIEIHGTYDEPLFKAKDIGDLLDIKRVRDTVSKLDDECKIIKAAPTTGGLQEQWFLTEDGLYELLFISRKPIAKEFKKWVRKIIKDIRINSNKQLQDKIKQLEYYKEPSYQQLLLNQTLYVFSTDIDNIYKIGKTTNNSKSRKEQLQTACVNNINILYEVKTSNCTLLETLVHFSLNKYRQSSREHFSCNLQHIKFVIDKCNKFINTIGSIRQHITEQEFTDKLQMQLTTDKMVPKFVEVEIPIFKTKYIYSEITPDPDIDELFS
jgi:prophage antirepressor-like protein